MLSGDQAAAAAAVSSSVRLRSSVSHRQASLKLLQAGLAVAAGSTSPRCRLPASCLDSSPSKCSRDAHLEREHPMAAVICVVISILVVSRAVHCEPVTKHVELHQLDGHAAKAGGTGKCGQVLRQVAG